LRISRWRSKGGGQPRQSIVHRLAIQSTVNWICPPQTDTLCPFGNAINKLPRSLYMLPCLLYVTGSCVCFWWTAAATRQTLAASDAFLSVIYTGDCLSAVWTACPGIVQLPAGPTASTSVRYTLSDASYGHRSAAVLTLRDHLSDNVLCAMIYATRQDNTSDPRINKMIPNCRN